MIESKLSTLRSAMVRPTPAAALTVFRIGFGALVAVGAMRFLAYGWVDRFFGLPKFFFKYWGFEWVVTAPVWALKSAFLILMALGVWVACGVMYRASIIALFLLFSYLELLDVTNYLNHYYLVTLLAFLMCFMPLDRAKLNGHLPRWPTYLLRFQVGIVYVYAAIAKFNTDWLVHAQPLNLWLSSRTETPLIGWLFSRPYVPLAMSWLGFLNDLLIVPFLLHRRTRVWAYAWVTVFHILTAMLFSIGMFPWIMMVSATVFLADDWPVRVLHRLHRVFSKRSWSSGPAFQQPSFKPLSTPGLVALCSFMAIQVLLPMRGWFYPGPVNWHEQGMRFSWRVMVREKNGHVTYRVHSKKTGRKFEVEPSRYLTDWQEREMATQPDMILQLAHHVCNEHSDIQPEVFVDAHASLNGRRAQRIIDPKVNLCAVNDGFAKAEWVLPLQPRLPLQLHYAARQLK